MKQILYYILFSISVLAIPYFIFCMANVGISLKYETENPKDCISLVSGRDLCQSIINLEILVGLCVIVIITLIVFYKKIFWKTIIKE
ncbi:MAG: ABC-type Mn2+/Zn2+ transport system permease subunit [Crocinitomix sp.]|jgi:ABC-type Mn2+/Zn2+ transport system permease subunit